MQEEAASVTKNRSSVAVKQEVRIETCKMEQETRKVTHEVKEESEPGLIKEVKDELREHAKEEVKFLKDEVKEELMDDVNQVKTEVKEEVMDEALQAQPLRPL